jgi:tetratricopeptide (TPR) repeat protein
MYFEKWSQGKDPILKMISFVFASRTDLFIEFFQDVKSWEQVGRDFSLPPANEWLKFYRSHRRIYKGVMNAFRQINDDTAKAIDYFEKLLSATRNLKYITNSEFQEIKEELTTAERNKAVNQFQEIQEIIENDFNIGNVEMKEETKAKEIERLLTLFHKPEMIFFTMVWAPCLLLYGDYAPRLLRKARHGDDDALEKLLRLDETVIADKKIIDLFHQGKVAKKQATYNLFIKSLSKKPKGKLTSRKIKLDFAGLISAISISLGQRLTTPDIKGLFDAISKDEGKGSDTDFQDQNQPEALRKAVNRARSRWPTIPQPDKK